MKKLRFFLVSVLCCAFFLSCDVLTSALNLVNCKYEIGGLGTPSIAGVSLNSVQNINSLNAMSLLKVTTAIMSGSLPFGMTVNVDATNPNTSAASIEGMEWAVDLENKTLFTGNVDSRVTVPANGGKTVIPLNFQIDLMQVLKGESKDNILNLAQSLLNIGESSSKVALKIKPSIMVGGQKISAPNFITLSKKI